MLILYSKPLIVLLTLLDTLLSLQQQWSPLVKFFRVKDHSSWARAISYSWCFDHLKSATASSRTSLTKLETILWVYFINTMDKIPISCKLLELRGENYCFPDLISKKKSLNRAMWKLKWTIFLIGSAEVRNDILLLRQHTLERK